MKLAIGPDDPTQSVAFLVGGAGWADGYLMAGTKWCQAIQQAAGGAPGVQVEKLPPQATGMPAVVDKLSRGSLTAQLSNATLDASFGGLRGHSLVILSHGLVADGGGDAQGVLLFNRVKGESPLDVTLWTTHLELMVTRERASGLPEDADVVPSPGLNNVVQDADGKKLVREVRDLAAFVNAIRQSIYQRVYLAACGGEHRLERFAKQLSVLTLKSVYYNLATISFPKPPKPPSAAVGPLHGDDVDVVSGTKFFRDPSDAANSVRLESTETGFLPGAQGLAP
jgi:hypothetical protein